MLSILIPVYAETVVRLVSELVRQGRMLDIPFELIVLDDGSPEVIKKENQSIADIPEVTYENLPKNLGRSAIRNRLGTLAKYPYLLFLDCDSYPAHKDFLKKYIENSAPDTVLVGGTAYADVAPKGKALHWLVGSKREVVPAVRRALHPHHGFSSFNFVVPKAVFNKIKFDNTITQYGHEDTLYGWSLKKAGINVKHLDNQLVHSGLDEAGIFLEKRRTAIRNLLILQKKYPTMDTKLLRTYDRISAIGLRSVVVGLYEFFEHSILKNLKSNRPSLLFFFWWSLVTLDRGRKQAV